jgi:hypothetical protein
MHLTDEQIQRILHGELHITEKDSVLRHAAACGSCVRQIEDAERDEQDIFELLGAVDHPVPDIPAVPVVSPPRPASVVWMRRAAGFIVVAALAGAAYAMPGSPLPGFLHQAAAWITGQGDTTTPPAPPAPGESATASQPVTSGIAVPVSERFTIHFAAGQSTGTVAVSLTDSLNVVVRVLGGTATFTTDADRLTIENRGSTADYEIELPRMAAWVEITVGPNPDGSGSRTIKRLRRARRSVWFCR